MPFEETQIEESVFEITFSFLHFANGHMATIAKRIAMAQGSGRRVPDVGACVKISIAWRRKGEVSCL